MGLLDGQTNKKSWLDPQTGLIFHNDKYNWNNTDPFIETPTTEGFVVGEDLSTFTDITPTIQAASPAGLLEEDLESLVLEEITEEIPETLLTPQEAPVEETPIDFEALRNNVDVGLQGVNQFFHGVIDKEFDGGFMGFNPVNNMAHSKIGEHMRMYENPDKITQDMVDNTRAMIIDKAGSQLGPEKTAYILERFNQYVLRITAYQNAMGGR
jgi:hypothetical protein